MGEWMHIPGYREVFRRLLSIFALLSIFIVLRMLLRRATRVSRPKIPPSKAIIPPLLAPRARLVQMSSHIANGHTNGHSNGANGHSDATATLAEISKSNNLTS